MDAVGEAKAVLVIGSTGGIGSAVVDQVAREGRPVVGVDLKPRPPVGAGGGFPTYEFDAAERSDLEKVLAAHHDVRHVINVAGGALPAEVDGQVPPDDTVLAETMRSNFETCLATIDAVVSRAQLENREAGDAGAWSITFCSSINAIGSYSLPLYSASKAAIESLATTMAVPLGQKGIRINCVRLGTVMTPRSRDLHHDSAAHYARLREQTALGRFVAASEAAAALVNLAVHLTGCTGTVLTVDCGQSIPGSRS